MEAFHTLAASIMADARVVDKVRLTWSPNRCPTVNTAMVGLHRPAGTLTHDKPCLLGLPSPDMMMAAHHCLDTSYALKFTKIATLATMARRTNVLDLFFLPSAGARKCLDDLLLTGGDLFVGQFQMSMEAEVKRLNADNSDAKA